MQRAVLPQKALSLADGLILLLIATVIYGLVAMGNEWRADFHPETAIDLSAWALPKYVLLSATRGVIAYFISLAFTLVVGYVAANSKVAEKIVLPLLDILQSIPVLGFLPGLVLGLISLFPRTNVGLELAAILMIFTGQVWNMTFSFYQSLKSIPEDFRDAATVIGMSRMERLKRVELPFAAVGLTWNSLLSMAGGWFFLTVCEAFTLGDLQFRLPGIGSYMAVAIARGNTQAMILGIIAMMLLIIVMDYVIWRPLLSWVQRFRLDEVEGVPEEPLIRIFIRESRIVRWLKVVARKYRSRRRFKTELQRAISDAATPVEPAGLARPVVVLRERLQRKLGLNTRRALRFAEIGLACALGVVMALAAWKLWGVLSVLESREWWLILRNTLWTFLRVFFSVVLGSLWAVPVGVWIATSPKRTRIAQPIIQVLASFPAPMLYPLALTLLFWIGVEFNWSSMFLMLLGVQWYVLFNVLAGALRIPRELGYALSLMESSRWDRWKTLYLPSIFPSLVTGWVNAAGGAWNASIVAEYLWYKGEIYQANGLGSMISVAAANKNLPLLAASVTVMVGVVVVFNRLVWDRLYRQAMTRYRMEF